jgi:tryptophan synthase alpha chain
MNRLEHRIQEVLRRGEKVLCGVLPLGDPDLQTSQRLVGLFLDAGVDIVELMIPSRDPYFDSSQIYGACRRALRGESAFDVYLDTIGEIRSAFPEEPFEVMTYADVVDELGVERFVQRLDEANIQAHLLADSIAADPSLLREMDSLLARASTPRIRFMPHPFREDLLLDIAENARGFMILQSIADDQGERPTVDPRNRELIDRLREAGTQAAILLGYGVRDPERMQEAVDLNPDGVIVGSAIMDRIADEDFDGLDELLRNLKSVMKPEGRR